MSPIMTGRAEVNGSLRRLVFEGDNGVFCTRESGVRGGESAQWLRIGKIDCHDCGGCEGPLGTGGVLRGLVVWSGIAHN